MKRPNTNVDPVVALQAMLDKHGGLEQERLAMEKRESEIRVKREEMLYKADLLMKFNELVKSGVDKETIFIHMPEMRTLQPGGADVTHDTHQQEVGAQEAGREGHDDDSGSSTEDSK
jgi:hypothetical protein